MATQLKKEFKDKLVELGVYEQWEKELLTFLEKQRHDVALYIKHLNKNKDFYGMIMSSFVLDTSKKDKFWRDIATKFDDQSCYPQCK